MSTGTVLARRGAHGSVDPGPRLDYLVRLSDEGVLPDGLGHQAKRT
jgi:hypothetical protein